MVTVGERNIKTPIKYDDLRLIIQSLDLRGSTHPARDTAYDYSALPHGQRNAYFFVGRFHE